MIRGWLDSLVRDISYAARGIRRQAGVSLTVVVVLGTAIGLNATLVTFVVGVLVRPWGGIHAATQVVRLYVQDPTGPATGFSVSDARTLAANNRSFSGVGVLRSESVRVGDRPGTATKALLIDGGLFDMLGVTPAPSPVVMLGYHYWAARFGRSSGVVGTTLRINDVPFTVVGVASQGFSHSEPGYDTQLFLPLHSLALLNPGDANVTAILTDPGSCCVDVVARLREGTTIQDAAAEFDVLARAFTAVSGARARGGIVTDTAFASQPGRRDSGQALTMGAMLAGALVLVWFIACANIGNLLLARAAGRVREMGTRLALGASRARLVRQLLTEGVVLASIAGAVGVAVAWQLPFVILRLVAGSEVAALFPFKVTPDAWVLAYVLALGASSVIAFALAPALLVTRSALRSTATPVAMLSGRLTLRSVLLSVQVAVSVVLLLTAALMVRGVQHQATAFEPGFDVDDMTLLSFELPEDTYDRDRAAALFADVTAAAERHTAGRFAFASHQPFSQYHNGTTFHLPGEGRDQARQLLYLDVSPRYLELMGISLQSGRHFDARDARMPRVIVNDTLARRYWPGEIAVGKTFYRRPRGPVHTMIAQEVIGVVKDVRATTFAEPIPMFYRAVEPGSEVLDYISADPRASQAPVLLVKGDATAAAALEHYVAVAVILTVCGVAATYVPARRAARISPTESLRAE